MPASRAEHLKIPGKFVFSPASSPVALYSSDGWKAEIMETLVALKSTRYGDYDQVVTGRLVKIEGRPTQFTTAGLAKLFTHGAVRLGGSIVGSTDQIGMLHTVDGRKRTMKCVFVYTEPAMNCLAGSTILGNVVIYGIMPLTRGSDDLDNLYKEEALAWTDADWNPDHEITPGWNFSWPIDAETASAWDDIDVGAKGVIVTPKTGLDEDISARDGLVNVTKNNYGVEVSATVMNISETLVLDALGRSLKMGQRKSSLGRDLILNATDGSAFIRAYNAVLQPSGFSFNEKQHVVGDLTWQTFPSVTSGVQGAHLLVSTVDPDA